jgi:hypothetical protein
MKVFRHFPLILRGTFSGSFLIRHDRNQIEIALLSEMETERAKWPSFSWWVLCSSPKRGLFVGIDLEEFQKSASMALRN